MGTSQDFLLHYQVIVNPVQLHELSALVNIEVLLFLLTNRKLIKSFTYIVFVDVVSIFNIEL